MIYTNFGVTGLSLPHVILVLVGLMTSLTIAALQIDLSQRRAESKPLLWLSFIPMAVGFWAWLAVAVGDSELAPPRNMLAAGHLLLSSPGWWYIVRGVLPGAFVLSAASGLVGSRWAATTLTLVLNAWSIATFGVLSLLGNPFARMATSLFCIGAAAAADLWRQRAGRRRPAIEGLVFTSAYLLISLLGTAYVTRMSTLRSADIVASVPVGLIGGAIVYVLGHGTGTWLRSLPGRIYRPSGAAAVAPEA